jgi:hypothetical protein
MLVNLDNCIYTLMQNDRIAGMPLRREDEHAIGALLVASQTALFLVWSVDQDSSCY